MRDNDAEVVGTRVAVPSAEAAHILGVSNTSIANWFEQGRLEGYRVFGGARSRLFIFRDSIERLQLGRDRESTLHDIAPNIADNGIAEERDRWRLRAVQAETSASFLRSAFDEVLASAELQAQAGERLRRAIELQLRALDQHAVSDDELAR